MAIERVVLVHGGMLGSWCWEAVLPHVELPVVAVNLPGRPGVPGPVTLDGWAEVIGTAAGQGPGRSLVVGHSLGGLPVLAAARRAAGRIGAVLLAAAIVPVDGECYWDLLPAPARGIRRALGLDRRPLTMPRLLARHVLCHDLSAEDAGKILTRLVPEPGPVLATPVRGPLPATIATAYVHTTRDRAIRPGAQRRFAARLPGSQRFSLDCGHGVFYARPRELAEIINRFATQGPGGGERR